MKKIITEYNKDEIRQLILRYFYDRNLGATSRKGKKGSSVKMKDVKSELKARHSFSDSQIVSNLNYLISQGWVEEEIKKKSFTNSKGFSFPSETPFYCITAPGIDKIEGPGRFTPKRFEGINIDAVGSVVTIGDGNQINIKYKEAAQALSDLRNAVTQSAELKDDAKLDIVTDIDSIQDQLAKPNPNKSVIKTLWENINRAASIASLADIIVKVSPFIISLFQ